jgi:hypothetical protein
VYSKVLQSQPPVLVEHPCAGRIEKERQALGKLRFKGAVWFKALKFNQSGLALENGKFSLEGRRDSHQNTPKNQG